MRRAGSMVWMESYSILRLGSSGEDALVESAESGPPEFVPAKFLWPLENLRQLKSDKRCV
jgi:hypothetical protein